MTVDDPVQPLVASAVALGDDAAPHSADQAAPTSVLGKYRLIARLARGGMGVLYLAVLRGPGGFHKLVALKELRRDFADDEALVKMFLEEARLAARLNHPNIVQTMEVGSSAGRHFMAMEYLEGQSLQRLALRAQERGTPVPLAMQLGITLDLLAALEYAHRLAAADGTPLGIVHRDVSPHNVLVTYEGQVKLVDFGVAKSRDGLESLRTGVLTGKAKYMSPEQAACGPVDARADLFSVGVMLWEAVVGRRAWEGRSEGAVLQSLAQGAVPRVRDARPDADPELAAVVERAMSVDPEARYPSALAMREDLERYMVSRALSPLHTRALSALLARLFAEDREKLRTLVHMQLRSLDAEAPRRNSSLPPTQLAMSVSVPAPPLDVAAQAPASFAPARVGEAGLASGLEQLARQAGEGAAVPAPRAAPSAPPLQVALDVAAPSALLAPPPTPRVTKGLLVGAAAVLGAVVALAAFAVGRTSAGGAAAGPVGSAAGGGPQAMGGTAASAVASGALPAVAAGAAARRAHVVIRASPASSQIFLDDQDVGNPYVADHVRDGSVHAVRVQAAGYDTKTTTVAFAGDVDVAVDLGVREPAPAAAPARPRAGAPRAAPPATSAPESAAAASGVRPASPEARPAAGGPKPIDTGNPYAP